MCLLLFICGEKIVNMHVHIDLLVIVAFPHLDIAVGVCFPVLIRRQYKSLQIVLCNSLCFCLQIICL